MSERLKRVRARLKKLGKARVFRRSRTLYWRARYHREKDPKKAGKLLRRARDSALLGSEIRETQRVLKRREVFLQSKKDKAAPKNGIAQFDGKSVAAWIVPWLERSRKAGWKGTVVSGYRTPEYSESLCQNMCGAPSCPGRCAGKASNHSGKDYPAGAIDVSDYYTFAAVQRNIDSPLKNALGAQDPVHFSISGR